MNHIQLEIEGAGAIAATHALQEIDGLDATYETVGEDTKEVALATIASIVSISAGTATLATHLYNWHKACQKKAAPQRLEKAVLVDRYGENVLMENATIAQIQAVLER